MADKEVLDLDGIPVRDSRLKPQTSHWPAMQSEYTDKLAAALAAARSKYAELKKTAKSNFGMFCPLDKVFDAVVAANSEHGLSLTSSPTVIGDEDYLVTTLAHSSGQFIRAMSRIRANPQKPQEVLSFCTYYRRLHVASLCGVAADSDLDGEGLKGAEPPKVSPAMGLARSALRGARSEQERDTVLAKAAMSVVSKRMTEEQLADLRAEREEMAPIQKVVPEATKEGAGA
jgi:hypothetical protein